MLIRDNAKGEISNAPKIIAMAKVIKSKEVKFVPMLVKNAVLNPYIEALRITSATTGPGVAMSRKTARI